jgi:hypothetical protein
VTTAKSSGVGSTWVSLRGDHVRYFTRLPGISNLVPHVGLVALAEMVTNDKRAAVVLHALSMLSAEQRSGASWYGDERSGASSSYDDEP